MSSSGCATNTVLLPVLGAFIGVAGVVIVVSMTDSQFSTTVGFLVTFPLVWFAFTAALWPQRRRAADEMAQQARGVLAREGQDPLG